MVYLETVRYKHKVRTNRVTYYMFSGAKIAGPVIIYPLQFTLITTKFSKNQHIRKSFSPTEMLCVELIMFFQPEPNKNRLRKGKFKSKIFSGA